MDTVLPSVFLVVLQLLRDFGSLHVCLTHKVSGAGAESQHHELVSSDAAFCSKAAVKREEVVRRLVGDLIIFQPQGTQRITR